MPIDPVHFFAAGMPESKGSMSGYYNEHLQRVILTQNNQKECKLWEKIVRNYAYQAWGDRPLLDHACRVVLVFYFPRPKKHYRTGKYSHVLRPNAPIKYVVNRCHDRDKLIRPVLDAMTDIVYIDDGFVWKVEAEAWWLNHGKPGVTVTIYDEPDTIESDATLLWGQENAGA